MPVSRPEALNDILKFVWETEPQSILDIGIGFGAMGVLFREAMDIRWGRYEDWSGTIDGVEIFSKYRNPIWSYIYNRIYEQDARKLDYKNYDMIFLGDVIEHLAKPEALQLLQECMKKAKYVLVTTPETMSSPNEPVKLFGNINEKHLSFLEDSDFPKEAQIIHYQHQKLIIISCN